jgi:hypothetical protein
MDNPNVTLMQFLDFDESRLTRDQGDSLLMSACMKEFRKRVPPHLQPSMWPNTARDIGNALASALRLRLADVLVAGWNKYYEISKYKDRKKYPSDAIIEVPLAGHTFTSSHEPRVEILANGARVADIRFQVDLEIEVECAVLTIQDAKIKSISTGMCEGTGTLRCESLVFAKTSKSFTIPGTASFGEGVPIA